MRQTGRTYTERVAKERSQRELARLCPPHPRTQIYLSKGDYWTPAVWRCGRCGRDVKKEDAIDD